MKDILPDKPSELLHLAIQDLKAVLEDSKQHPDKVQVDMKVWHASNEYGFPCIVCFAGSVLRQTLKVSDEVDFDVSEELFEQEYRKLLSKLKFLDRCRAFQWFMAFNYSKDFIENMPPNTVLEVIFQHLYSLEEHYFDKEQPEKFIEQMEKAALIFKNHGL